MLKAYGSIVVIPSLMLTWDSEGQWANAQLLIFETDEGIVTSLKLEQPLNR